MWYSIGDDNDHLSLVISLLKEWGEGYVRCLSLGNTVFELRYQTAERNHTIHTYTVMYLSPCHYYIHLSSSLYTHTTGILFWINDILLLSGFLIIEIFPKGSKRIRNKKKASVLLWYLLSFHMFLLIVQSRRLFYHWWWCLIPLTMGEKRLSMCSFSVSLFCLFLLYYKK